MTFKTYEGNYWIVIVGIVAALLGLAFAFLTARTIMKKEVGSEKLKELAGFIREGATAFLNAEYKVIIWFIAGVIAFFIVGIFALDMDWQLIPAFLLGALFSASAGNIGMKIATMANAKTAWACKDSKKSGLRVAFNSGSVMGLTVVGLGLLGVSLLFIIFGNVDMLFGFGFGASSIALFARVGGGIYTKAADVGADLVGKVEAGIPEDDPRNPATIADNVGDNVGDVAGMGADLFESYVDSIIAAMALGIVGVSALGADLIGGGAAGVATLLPLILAGVGIICSVLGTFAVGAGSETRDAHKQLNRGIWVAAGLMTVASLGLIWFFFKDEADSGKIIASLFFSMIAGLVSGIIIGKVTEYYTSDHSKPTQRVSEASTTGAGPNIIAGLGLGMLSTAVPVIAVVFTIIIAYVLSGLYGIALAAVGMLSTLGITLATDTYGPVADNAAGLAEMGGMGKKVRETAEELDAVGNTTAAIGKGFAIGSAALTALALFSAFTQAANLDLSSFTLVNPFIVAGLFIGGLLPFIFSALTMQAVGEAAQDMVEEVRRQFKSIKGIMEGKAKPDYEKCVAISTKGALKKMIVPSLLAVLAPIVVGSISMEALGGLLAGSIVTGFVLAVMMANSGGSWDNAKKYIESGHFGGKGSDAHKAAVIGDTVGDPFKDTSGPSLNILIKLMSIVALVFVPLFIVINALIASI
ncbi:MAG: sodium-translocating pyrophosphatase [Thermoplasmatota archaeon]